MRFFNSFFFVLLAISASHGMPTRDERGFFDNMMSMAAGLGGKLGNMLSPEAVGSFCKAEGYSQWTGAGPEPQAHEGAVSQGLSMAGGLGGMATDLLKGGFSGGGMDQVIANNVDGTCTGAGWQRPRIDVQYIQGVPPRVYE